ncbi:alpha/beta fold hydrolase [Actinomadura rugatobispora]|uniref:Alpha/beta fold hydrolase n=1 Tax=Actinomadura rugatobispora TaxID=1994 RepID=A0ABW1A4D2_9ACTN
MRFHVVDLGAGRPGAGPRTAEPLVMLHGLFTGSAASWFFTVAPALARTRPVRLPDMRGHGLSERTPTGYDTATLAADLAALTAGLPPFALAGHSYGAAVAVRFARAHPGRVTRLALIDPPFAGACGGVPAPALLAREPGRRSGVRALLEQTSVLADLAAEPAVTAADLGALEGVPVLAVAGEDSPFRAACDLVGQALPAARCHVLPGGHDLHLTARHRLGPLLEAFLAEEPSPCLN